MSVEKLSGLPAFVRSVEAGSFTAAARALGTTPSAVSKSVARLEKRLGVTLFQRSTRAFILTSEGQTYYEHIAPLMRGLAEADEALAKPATAVGTLRVSLPGDLGRALLEPVTRQLMARNRELSLEVSVSDRHVDVIREGFDIAIRVGHAVDSSLYTVPMASLPLVLVASPAYLQAAGAPRTIEDLTAHRHVRYRLNGRAIPITFANGTALSIGGSFDADSGDAMRIAAVNGLGIAQILRTTVQHDLDAGRLHIVLPDVSLRSVPVQALHAFGRSVPTRARLFIDFIAEQLALSE
ncbi:LysR family transcriptional regulator [Paraburkholderia azotifigens]|uniref:LysR family transcriptional regulator n=1 Tax=Paraburkholderia azotifigens TaxID=2057004 RepID=UPI0038B7988D